MDLYKEALKVVSLWVKLFDVPMEYWNNVGLSYIMYEVRASNALPQIMEVGTPCEDSGEEKLMIIQGSISGNLLSKDSNRFNGKSVIRKDIPKTSTKNRFQSLSSTPPEEPLNQPPEIPKPIVVANGERVGWKWRGV
ncbi:hypothetical protein Patl1_05619 [Pistacia atlantica]|uniref:Uncharacterized protein n=1 Tax=Pistacia atlantica TaxID=434234 RepID=A0ACC1BSP9_9ROSI|nr:hypothetical protein Patl1_05619 [Pistacia atlantica]